MRNVWFCLLDGRYFCSNLTLEFRRDRSTSNQWLVNWVTLAPLSSQLYFKVPDMTLSGCCVDQHSVQVYSSTKPRIVTCEPATFFAWKFVLFAYLTKLQHVLFVPFQPENFCPKSTLFGIQREPLQCLLDRWCSNMSQFVKNGQLRAPPMYI